MLGWTLGTNESILISILAGFSVDYVVHLAHSYVTADGSTDDRIKSAFGAIGASVFQWYDYQYVRESSIILLQDYVLHQIWVAFFEFSFHGHIGRSQYIFEEETVLECHSRSLKRCYLQCLPRFISFNENVGNVMSKRNISKHQLKYRIFR